VHRPTGGDLRRDGAQARQLARADRVADLRWVARVDRAGGEHRGTSLLGAGALVRSRRDRCAARVLERPIEVGGVDTTLVGGEERDRRLPPVRHAGVGAGADRPAVVQADGGHAVIDDREQEHVLGADRRHAAGDLFRGGTGPRPGIDLRSNRALLEALDEDVELNDRR
jgi:hypothetical protein